MDLDHPKIWIQFSLNFLHLRLDNEILQPFLQRCSCKISFQSLPPSPSQLLSCIFKTPKSLSRKLHSCERPSETPIARPFTCTLLHSLLIRKRRKKSLHQSLHLVNYPPPPSLQLSPPTPGVSHSAPWRPSPNSPPLHCVRNPWGLLTGFLSWNPDSSPQSSSSTDYSLQCWFYGFGCLISVVSDGALSEI